MKGHESRESSRFRGLKRLLPERKPPVSVVPEYNTDGSCILHAETDGQQVMYKSDEPYTLTLGPNLLTRKLWKMKPDDELEYKGTGPSLTITDAQGTKTTMVRIAEHDIFRVSVRTMSGVTKEATSRYGQIRVMHGITQEAAELLLKESDKRFRSVARKLHVKDHENKARSLAVRNSV